MLVHNKLFVFSSSVFLPSEDVGRQPSPHAFWDARDSSILTISREQPCVSCREKYLVTSGRLKYPPEVVSVGALFPQPWVPSELHATFSREPSEVFFVFVFLHLFLLHSFLSPGSSFPYR